MAILSFSVGEVGQVGQTPRRNKLLSTGSLSTITTAGYLNNTITGGQSILPTDIFDVTYNYSAATGTGTYGLFTPSFSAGIITLVQWVDAGNVLLPVVSGDLASFNGTQGQIQDSGILASNVMSIATTNTMASAGRILLAKGTATEASNAVTLSKQSGVITTSSLTTAGGSTYAITWTNTLISTSSSIVLSWMGGTNTTANFTMSATAGSGTSTLTIFNNTASTALNGTIFIGFTVF